MKRLRLAWACIVGAVLALFDPDCVEEILALGRKAQLQRIAQETLGRHCSQTQRVREQFEAIGHTTGFPYNDKHGTQLVDVAIWPEFGDLPIESIVYIKRFVNA